MISTTRRPFQIGGSKAVTIPGRMIIGGGVSISGSSSTTKIRIFCPAPFASSS